MTAVTQVPPKSLPHLFHSPSMSFGVGPSSCAGCRRPIQDQYLLHVLDRSWHAGCVLCADCGQPQQERCYTRDGKIFCREDFFKRFGEKCAVCSIGIPPNVLVRKARGKVFHLACFACMVCRKQLTTGEELVVFDESKFMCKEDYISSKIKCQQQQQQQHPVLEKGIVKEEMMEELAPTSERHMVSSSGGGGSGDVSAEVNSLLVPGCLDVFQHDLEELDSMGAAEFKGEPNNNSSNSHNHNSASNLPSPSSSDNGDVCLGLLEHDKMDKDKENDLELDDLSKVVDDDIDLDDGCGSDKGSSTGGAGGSSNGTGKRRGPRTTIKAKQLETLKSAFAATPKPTRHIREQLAQETGLNMRVIQVWFQNRRSKERRMKQLSAMGARRGFFRNPRRMRALRAGTLGPDDMGSDHELLAAGAFSYFGENGSDFYGGYGPPSGYPTEFFHPAGQPPHGHPHFMSGQPGQPDSLHGMTPDGQFFSTHPDFINVPPASSTPELQQRLAAMDAVVALQQQAAAVAALTSGRSGPPVSQHQISHAVSAAAAAAAACFGPPHTPAETGSSAALEVW